MSSVWTPKNPNEIVGRVVTDIDEVEGKIRLSFSRGSGRVFDVRH